MKKAKLLTEYQKPFDLAEVYQKSGIRYAFLSAPRDGSAMCHAWVKCRDFLHDAVRAQITGKPVTIYGFKFVPGEDPPIDLKRIRMRIKSLDMKIEDFRKVVYKGVEILNHYEHVMGSKATSSAIAYDDGSFVISGPSIWLKSPILTTLFSFVFRIAEKQPVFKQGDSKSLTQAYEKIITDTEDINHKDNKDIKYLSDTYKYLPVITENYEALCELYNKKYDPVILNKEYTIGSYHNYSGIVSLCRDGYMLKSRFEFLKVLVEESKEGKALLRVKNVNDIGPYNTYRPNEMQMAFIHSKEDVRTVCNTFTSCREQLIGVYRARHAEADHLEAWRKDTRYKDVYMDDEKLRLVVRVPGVLRDRMRMAVHKKEMFFAKRVINYYEKYLGIKKSVISTVLIQSRDGAEYGWLFTASAEWLQSPVMLSIYVAIIRSAKVYLFNHLRDAENYPEPENINATTTKKMWAKLDKDNVFLKGADKVIYSHSAKVMLVLKNREALFGVNSTDNITKNFFIGKKNLLNNSMYVAYSTRSGISSLLNSTHIDQKLVKKFNELEK
jgi:hypothetical protein